MANGYRPEQYFEEEFERPVTTVDMPVVTYNHIRNLASSEVWIAYDEDDTALLKSVISALKTKLACIRAELSAI